MGEGPRAPGAHEGTAGVKNALDALDWVHLAVTEGSVVQVGEYSSIALHAIRRSIEYMNKLIALQQCQGRPAPTTSSKRKMWSKR